MRRHLRALGLSLFLGLACMAAPGRASAQEANGFGDKTQLILSVDRLVPLFSYSSATVTNNQGLKTTDSGTSIAVLLGQEPSVGVVHTIPRVAFDFVVVHRLTLGGAFAFATGLGGTHQEDAGNGVTRSSNTPKTTIVGLAPRVGYIIPLGNVFAFWPRAGFGYYSVSTKTERVAQGNLIVTTTDSDSLLSLDLDPQFVWTPIHRFFINFGPLLNVPISGSRETTAGANTLKNDLSVLHIGVEAGLGGWFDL